MIAVAIFFLGGWYDGRSCGSQSWESFEASMACEEFHACHSFARRRSSEPGVELRVSRPQEQNNVALPKVRQTSSTSLSRQTLQTANQVLIAGSTMMALSLS